MDGTEKEIYKLWVDANVAENLTEAAVVTLKWDGRERKSRAESDRRRSVAEENEKGVYKVVIHNRVACCMLQGSSLHRAVERVRGRVAEKRLEKRTRCERRL